jgi:transcriptional regulator with XRE-family HTH domain
MSMLEIGNNIRRIREIKNYTQEAVAGIIGMSVTAYGDIERGKSDVNFTRLGEIAAALEVKPEEIVTFGNNIFNTTNNHQDGSVIHGGHTGSGPATFNNYVDKDIFDKIVKDKDEEIAFLREQLRNKS